jgi:hypothetical protein
LRAPSPLEVCRRRRAVQRELKLRFRRQYFGFSHQKASTSRHESKGQANMVHRPRDPAAFRVRNQAGRTSARDHRSAHLRRSIGGIGIELGHSSLGLVAIKLSSGAIGQRQARPPASAGSRSLATGRHRSDMSSQAQWGRVSRNSPLPVGPGCRGRSRSIPGQPIA